MSNEITMTSDIKAINNRINKEHNSLVEKKLSDENLMQELKEQKSVKNKINKNKKIFKDAGVSEESINKIINNQVWLKDLIPAGTKGNIRGNKFNSNIKNEIKKLNLDEKEFEICFEKNFININEEIHPNEKTDWFIRNKKTGKIIFGMNQISLWGGGAQSNRGTKYLINNKSNTEKSKLLCVVCNKIQFENNKNKTFKLFKVGFKNNTLCYINNLGSIIKKFFKIR